MRQNSSRVSVVYKSLAFLGFAKYRVGDDGSVWRLWEGRGWERCKDYPVATYRYVCLSNREQKLISVHRLVLTAFVGPCSEGMECCHGNNTRTDNRLTNLRWDTRKKNQQDRVRFHTDPKGERNGSAKLTEREVRRIRRLHATGRYSYNQIARKFGIARCTVGNVVNRVGWKHVL